MFTKNGEGVCVARLNRNAVVVPPSIVKQRTDDEDAENTRRSDNVPNARSGSVGCPSRVGQPCRWRAETLSLLANDNGTTTSSSTTSRRRMWLW